MKELILILSLFRTEAAKEGLILPDSITIEYAKLGVDTMGVAEHSVQGWKVKISPEVEPDILETIVYHELGHVCGLDHCKGLSIMNYVSIRPLTQTMKRALFRQIKDFKKHCHVKY